MVKNIKGIIRNKPLLFSAVVIAILVAGLVWVAHVPGVEATSGPTLGVCQGNYVAQPGGGACANNSQCASGTCNGGHGANASCGSCQGPVVDDGPGACSDAADQCSSDAECGNDQPYGTPAWLALPHCAPVSTGGFDGCTHLECVPGGGSSCTVFLPAPPSNNNGALEDTISWDLSSASLGVYQMELTVLATALNGTGDEHQLKVVLGSQVNDSGNPQQDMTDVDYPLYPTTYGQVGAPVWNEGSGRFDRIDGANHQGPFAIGDQYNYPYEGQEVVIGIRNYDSCQGIFGPWVLMRVTPPPPTGPTGQCTGTGPGANESACAGDSTTDTDLPWQVVSSCTAGRQCEMTCNSGYTNQNGSCVLVQTHSCTGPQPAGTQICPDDTNVSVDTPWKVVSSCTILDKCEVFSSAPETGNVYGYAWSENVGWIQMNNCKDEKNNTTGALVHDGFADVGSCGDNNYGVRINNTNNSNPALVPAGPGTMTGSAWSENVGWIKFGGFAANSFPVGGNGTFNGNAELLADGGTEATFRGWGKAFWGDTSSGWDGWLSLAGTQHPSGPTHTDGAAGVTYDKPSARIVGYAWGGEVLGWVNFSNVTYGAPVNNFGYHLNAVPNQVNVMVNGSANTNIELTLDYGVSQTVTLTTSVPKSTPISATFNAGSTCVPTSAPTPCTKVLTISASNGAVGPYTVTVTGTTPGLSDKKATITVYILGLDGGGDGDGGGGGGGSAPTVSCDVAGSPPYLVNHPVTWISSNITCDSGPCSFSWTGEPFISGSGTTLTKTYSTTGIKTATLKITDTNGLSTSCSPAAQAAIIVQPNINEF